RTNAPIAVAWPDRSSCSWRRPRRYRYSIRSTSERGRQACCRNSARTRASAPGFPRPARRSSRYKLRICLCSRLGRLMAAAGPRAHAGNARRTVAQQHLCEIRQCKATGTSGPRASKLPLPALASWRRRAGLAVDAVTS
uniref:Uncharacterized protein n=1 Tax=Felis catus TaxID=9685 RepID=A0ABI8APF1_FELCA